MLPKDVRYWLKRAAQVRAIGATSNHPDAQDMMEAIAKEFEGNALRSISQPMQI
jgi:hypothetical protein